MKKALRKRKIIGIHFLTFVILTIVWFFLAEPALHQFASAFHNVEMWLNFIIYGTIGILILTIISCLIFIQKFKNKH
ncbi:hypothetical protein D2V93_16640 [Flagellimonas taeanensis]|nr:hypothetical protein D2V93_16640 [Allomuricauda taeanensis]